jgi:hypothetical protein
VLPGCGKSSACVIECAIVPPPEHVSHDSHPDICSMLLIVVPVGAVGAAGVVGGVVVPVVDGAGSGEGEFAAGAVAVVGLNVAA